MNQIYFEANGEKLLERIGMTKSEFARQMGIRKQNVKALFRTKNLETIYKAATVMGVPFPAILAMSLPLLSKRGGKEGQKNGDLLVSVLRKAGKANYTSRLATRGCACALIPVAILPVQRHRKQTQFLVSPSLGGGAF